MRASLKSAIYLLISIIIFAWSETAWGQRRITPVNPNQPQQTQKAKEDFDESRLQEQRDANGRIVLVDTVSGSEYVDSTIIIAPIGNIYPLITGVSVGVDIWDPVMRILGQQYGGIGFRGQLSLHNRFFPTFEAGVSAAKITPDDMNYTFKSNLAPYFKLGADYNIFYNSNNAYQFQVGLRYGFSPFSYSVVDIDSNNSYWDEATIWSIPSQKATVGYIEITAGVKVKIAGPVSMGWTFKYHTIAHESKNTYGPTMYVPGFGKRANALTGSFFIIYTIPLNKSAYPKVDIKEHN